MFKAIAKGILLGALSLTTVCAAAQDLLPMRVQVYPGNLTSLYAYLGVENGVYKKNGLDVSLINISSGPQANAALVGGSVDVVLSAPDNMLLFRERGFDPVAISGNAEEPLFVLMGQDSLARGHEKDSYTKVMHALAGKTVGIYGRGSSSDRFVRLLARDAGMDPDAIHYSAVSNPGQSLAGMMGKQLDAVTEVFAGKVLIQQKKAGSVLLDCLTQECPDWVVTTGKMSQAYWTTRAYLDKHEQAAERFLAANKELEAWLQDKANKGKLIASMEKIYSAPAGVDSKAYFSAIADQVPGYFTVAVNVPALDTLQTLMHSTGELKQLKDVKTMFWDKAF